jgi:hypothetical protein
MAALTISRSLLQQAWLDQGRNRWLRKDANGDPARQSLFFRRGRYTLLSDERVRRVVRWSQADKEARGDAHKCTAFAVHLWSDFLKFGNRYQWVGPLLYPWACGFFWSGHAWFWYMNRRGEIKLVEAQTDWGPMSLQPIEIRPGHWGLWLVVG